MHLMLRATVVSACLALTALFTTAGPALADTVVVGNQIFQGNVCAGTPCLDGNVFGNQQYHARGGNTPGIDFIQDGSSGFTPYQWDVAGNEANFFIRDLTGSSNLPLRIFPGALTNSLRVESNSMAASIGTFSQFINGQTVLGTIDDTNLLTALRGLPIETYRVNDDSTNSAHLRPNSAAFRAAFNLGPSDSYLADSDVAAIALAGVKTLDARVSALSLTPGPQGPAGSADLTEANLKIAKLQAANTKLAKSMKKLQKQMKRLARK